MRRILQFADSLSLTMKRHASHYEELMKNTKIVCAKDEAVCKVLVVLTFLRRLHYIFICVEYDPPLYDSNNDVTKLIIT